MKKTLLIFICSVAIRAIAQQPVDVLHYNFSIELSDANDTIFATSVITLRHTAPANKIAIDLVHGKDGMTVDGVSGDGVTSYQSANGKINLSLNRNAKVGDTSTYTIKYHGVPKDGLIISKNKFGKRSFFSDNWPNRAHHWLACIDDPADKATVEFAVTTPVHYQVVSNGLLVEETNLPGNKKLTRYNEEVELPTKVMVIGVADFAVYRAGEVGCTPVYSWVYPENKTNGFKEYASAKNILQYFIDYIGPFPYRKLANVQSKTIFGGMENAGAIFYHENSVTGGNPEEALFAHEIVHQWFGDHATEKSFAHLWLSEGFATYLTHVYLESKYGSDSLRERMKTDRRSVIAFNNEKARPLVDSTTNLMSLLNANSYDKGSWVLHMLRRQLGDEVFHAGIRAYYKKFAGRNAETRDLQRVFDSVSGKDLSVFFHQWTLTPGNLKLELGSRYDATEKKLTLVLSQKQPLFFQTPVTIGIQTEAGMQKYKINLVSEDARLDIPLKAKPLSIVLDPDVELLFEQVMVSRTKEN